MAIGSEWFVPPPSPPLPPFVPASPAYPPFHTCTNLCAYAFDNRCDDGGPGADYADCFSGTDCQDCGPRSEFAPPPSPTLPPPPANPFGVWAQCDNRCILFANDGKCDDGGDGSTSAVCHRGTDCEDCGKRLVPLPGLVAACSDSCMFANDGGCDDGGPGAIYGLCSVGIDCTDCGQRLVQHREGFSYGGAVDFNPPPPPLPSYLVCNNECTTAPYGALQKWRINNFICEDGDVGASASVCESGSDCMDCGPRLPQPSPPPLPPSPSPSPAPRLCRGYCMGNYGDGQKTTWTRDERCHERCMIEDGLVNWQMMKTLFREADGVEHNCVCEDTAIPGKVNTKMKFSQGPAGGMRLCGANGCFDSSDYKELPPQPRPTVEEFSEQIDQANAQVDVAEDASARDDTIGETTVRASDLRKEQCDCYQSETVCRDYSCVSLGDVDGNGHIDCDDCLSNYGKSGFCDCCNRLAGAKNRMNEIVNRPECSSKGRRLLYRDGSEMEQRWNREGSSALVPRPALTPMQIAVQTSAFAGLNEALNATSAPGWLEDFYIDVMRQYDEAQSMAPDAFGTLVEDTQGLTRTLVPFIVNVSQSWAQAADHGQVNSLMGSVAKRISALALAWRLHDDAQLLMVTHLRRTLEVTPVTSDREDSFLDEFESMILEASTSTSYNIRARRSLRTRVFKAFMSDEVDLTCDPKNVASALAMQYAMDTLVNGPKPNGGFACLA